MSETREILVVSFFYPPDSAVGGRRVAKFVRYLPEFGWAPTVLTARTAAVAEPASDVHATPYASPWKLLPKRASDERAAHLRERAARGGRLGRGLYRALRHVLPMSSVRMPDATLGWIPFAVAAGRRLLARQRFDAILSSGGPPSSHIVAARLQRRSGLPWIADYRDLWSENHWDTRAAPFQRLERRLERRVLRRASRITTVAPTWTRRLAELHGRDVDDVEVVFNGFDPADYPPVVRTDSEFVLLYVGTLIRPAQDPAPLFRALTLLKDRPGVDLDRLRLQVRFLGTAPGALGDLPQRHGVDRWVRTLPAVRHTESLGQQSAAAALLFIGWTDPGMGWLSAKLFEYLGAGRPLLAVGPPGGDASQILRDCGVADLSADPQVIAARLEAWLREFAASGRVEWEPRSEAVSRYTRRAQTGRLAQLLDAVQVSGAGGS